MAYPYVGYLITNQVATTQYLFQGLDFLEISQQSNNY